MAIVANHTKPLAAVVFNPTKQGVDVLRAAVAATEQQLGWAATVWCETAAEDGGTAATAAAVASGAQLVIAAGGDGTVRTVAGALTTGDAAVDFGIVPAGTGNLLARNLGLPVSDMQRCVEIAFARQCQPIDLLDVTAESADGTILNQSSLVLLGMGIDAAMIAETSDRLKERVGWIAYLDGMARALIKAKPFRVGVSLDGKPIRGHRVAGIMVANLADLPGNVSLSPNAAIDDGLLDVIVVQPRRLIDWLFIWRRFSWENPVLRRGPRGSRVADRLAGRNRNQVLLLRGKRVRLQLELGSHPAQIDGDSIGEVTALDVSVSTHAVRVAVPGN